ncbi:MAG TPA: penicillin-binding protein activator LpoB [Campylobacteraceae bacterium]|jgi:TolB-like protein|nr:penicillin-binding protein activator LpoB [Campylobacteraceae bacterium]HHD83577.1 penicillin-binding protein activator LpoB [Campylobacteraceae bacterium]
MVTLLKKALVALMPVLLFFGCSSMQIHKTALPEKATLQKSKIAVIPFYNYTQTPMAGYSAASIAATLLKAHGFSAVPQNLQPDSDTLTDENRIDLQKRIAIFRQQGYRYILSGEVTEWRYKSGIDAEPVVGLVINVIDTADGKVRYSAAGSQNALSTDALSTVAQHILDKLLP